MKKYKYLKFLVLLSVLLCSVFTSYNVNLPKVHAAAIPYNDVTFPNNIISSGSQWNAGYTGVSVTNMSYNSTTGWFEGTFNGEGSYNCTCDVSGYSPNANLTFYILTSTGATYVVAQKNVNSDPGATGALVEFENQTISTNLGAGLSLTQIKVYGGGSLVFWDTYGGYLTQTLNLTIKNQPPTISISNPPNNTTISDIAGFNSLPVSGTTLDPDVGNNLSVKYQIDSATPQIIQSLTATGNNQPFSTMITSNPSISEGTHTLT